MIRRLTQAEVPTGSLVAFLSDVHIPHHDERALRLAVEVCEAAGVTHVVLGGDIADCGPASRHEGKRRKDILTSGSLAESAAPGRWLIDWARSRPCYYIRGNHEAWVEDLIAGDAALVGRVTPEQLLGWPGDGDGWEVLPSKSRLRLGSLCMEHGDGFFPRSGGGASPAAAVMRKAPDQTTFIGHVHRDSEAWNVTADEWGIPRGHVAVSFGHWSLDHTHTDYAGSYPGWTQSMGLTHVWWEHGRPRFNLERLRVIRDRRNRPTIAHRGRVFR